jgi:hypothetical protein
MVNSHYNQQLPDIYLHSARLNSKIKVREVQIQDLVYDLSDGVRRRGILPNASNPLTNRTGRPYTPPRSPQ